MSILTPHDSKRVADAIINKIESSDFDIAGVIRDVLIPKTDNHWKEDWFPLIVEDMCNRISRAHENNKWVS